MERPLTARPRLERPLVRDLDRGAPRIEHPDGRSVEVDSAAFRAELARLRVFGVEYALGSFLVIAERRARGDRYWVARAYHRGRRASVYLGRDIGSAELEHAARELEGRLNADPALDPSLRAATSSPDPRAVEAVVRDLVDRERDPQRRAAAEAIAALVRGARHDTPGRSH